MEEEREGEGIRLFGVGLTQEVGIGWGGDAVGFGVAVANDKDVK